jgi:hypothetical protein
MKIWKKWIAFVTRRSTAIMWKKIGSPDFSWIILFNNDKGSELLVI